MTTFDMRRNTSPRNGSVGRPSRFRRALIATGSTAVMITAAALGSPATAQAWPWDPTVTVKGNDGCTLAQTGWIYAVASNGEVHYGTSGWGGAYSMTFGRVPSGGESIRFEVHCSMTGVHTTYRWISRPGWGTTVTTNI